MTSENPQLLLMRHAKSSWRHHELEDHDRPLNRRGKRAAREMAMFLLSQRIRPQKIVSSSAVRAISTAQAMAAEFGIDEIHLQPNLYHAGLSEWKHLLKRLPCQEITLLIGHNPALEELVSEIAGEDLVFPTAAIAACRMVSKQDSFDVSGLMLQNLWRPREI